MNDNVILAQLRIAEAFSNERGLIEGSTWDMAEYAFHFLPFEELEALWQYGAEDADRSDLEITDFIGEVAQRLHNNYFIYGEAGGEIDLATTIIGTLVCAKQRQPKTNIELDGDYADTDESPTVLRNGQLVTSFDSIEETPEMTAITVETAIATAPLMSVAADLGATVRVVERSTLRPEYTETRAAYTVDNQAPWRPELGTTEILHDMPLPKLTSYVRKSTPKAGPCFFAKTAELYALGRAIALLPYYEYVGVAKDGKGHVIRHLHENRVIKVYVEDGLAKVFEANYTNGQWVTTEHKLSQTVAIGLQTVTLQEAHGKLPQVTFVHGRTTRYYAPQFKAAGGVFAWKYVDGRRTGGWMFTGEMPQAVSEILATSKANAQKFNAEGVRLSKYHILAGLLQGKYPAVVGKKADIAQVQLIVHDAYIRETWRLAGWDWREFPARSEKMEAAIA